jgi:hypothetical protein
MFKQSLFSLVLIGAGAFGFSSLPASAMSVPVQQPAAAADSSANLKVDVADRRVRDGRVSRDRRVVRYDRRYHGPRCTRWGSNCRHYYRGYYYGSPWWTLPLVGTGIVIGSTIGRPVYRYRSSGSRHVNWCLNHYRSYNVRTNTFVTYGGAVRQCISPYGP